MLPREIPAREPYGTAGMEWIFIPGACCAMSGKLLRTTVILPVYNEAKIIGRVFREVSLFTRQHPDFGFLFVDDGSSDNTAGTLTELIGRPADSSLAMLSYSPNGGKGLAVWRGMQQSDSEFLIFTDGDLAYSLDHLPLLVEALKTHDVVMGSRNLTGGKQKNIQISRRIMGWGFNLLARMVLKLPYRDTQAGLKGFRLEAAKRIFTKQQIFDFCFDAELLFLARHLGFRIAEVPARVSESHAYRGSQVNLWRDPPKMLFSLIRIRCNSTLGRYDER
jgi:dolichyl-phosphate beta-glucosyltransferase